jgi:hypothetical protein
MKLQLLAEGYENFTGQMGAIDFVDGTSVHGVSAQQAATLQLVIHAKLVEPEPAPQE